MGAKVFSNFSINFSPLVCFSSGFNFEKFIPLIVYVV